MSIKTFTAVRRLALGMLLGVLVALTACGPAPSVAPAPAQSNQATQNPQANAEHQNADVEFALQMIEHHRRGVELAELVLSKEGVPAEVSALAAKIRAVHEPESAQLEGMLRTWGELAGSEGSQRSAAPEGEQSRGGVAADAVEELRAAQGESAGQLYLELMVAHHESSIALAEKEMASGTNPEAIALAESISTTQRQELERIRQLQR